VHVSARRFLTNALTREAYMQGKFINELDSRSQLKFNIPDSSEEEMPWRT
jgi:hypothetical protein